MPYIFFNFFILFSTSLISLSAEQISDSFRLDAYGNVTMLNTEVERDTFYLSGGFQGRYQFNDDISVTGQIHLKEGFTSDSRSSNSLEDYDAELKWLYIDYYLKNDITLRAGAFQFPVFKSSETGDIGYTYTWTETPLKFYGVFGCDDFEGIEVLKNFSYKNFDFLAQISYGQSSNELHDGRGTSREGDVNDLMAFTLKTTHDDFILNAGYLQANSELELRNAPLNFDSNVDFNMFALESEVYIDDFTLKSGFIKTNLTNIFPNEIKYYLSLEYSYDDFTPYILYSNEIFNFKKSRPPSPGPSVSNKEFNINKQYVEEYSLGLRYDYSANIAFKASYSHEVESRKYDGFSDDKNTNDTLLGTINVVF